MLREGAFIVDRYEIVSAVGSGGMSDVYKAKDHKLNRFVAIKVMKQEFSREDNFISKFQVEAQSAAGLAHPNIVSVYDVGEENGLYFIVMELVEGITLKKYIEKKGKLPVKEAISIAIQVSMGIEAAHKNHIIHRDIKPQNIIISKEGKVKVADFGIAKAATSNTISSNVMGSVHYTSPEQAKGGYSDEKSDIYSLGITIYEMITGRVPFDGDTTVSIAVKHIEEPLPEPSVFVPDIPYSVEQIILKCTKKKRERRYSNMTALISDLKRSLTDPEGDFVVIVGDDTAASPTRIVPEEEIEQIRKETGKIDVSDLNDLTEQDEEEPDEDEDEEMNPKLQKIMTVLGIVAAVIIVGIAIYLVGMMMGLFGNGSGNRNNTNKTTAAADEDDIEMISVLGMTFDEAKDALKEKNLGIRQNTTQEPSDVYKEGTIMEQSVKKGEKVKKNTTIVVTISSGEAQLEMIDVLNLDGSTATKRLEEELDAKVKEEFEYSDTVEEGRVISTSPKAGSSISPGSDVTIVLSRGPKPAEQVTVPNVSNGSFTEEQARTELTQKGLSVGSITRENSSSVPKGYVMGQSYSSGKKVDAGTAIDLVVSDGPKPTTAPPTTAPPATTATKAKNYTGTFTIQASKLPADFESGTVKITLTQTVNGADKTTTIYEGNLSRESDFPYTKTVNGAPDVNSGIIQMTINGTVVYTESITFRATD